MLNFFRAELNNLREAFEIAYLQLRELGLSIDPGILQMLLVYSIVLLFALGSIA